jgi:hypothetical protein
MLTAGVGKSYVASGLLPLHPLRHIDLSAIIHTYTAPTAPTRIAVFGFNQKEHRFFGRRCRRGSIYALIFWLMEIGMGCWRHAFLA